MGYVALGALALGAITKGYSEYEAGKQQSKLYKMNATLAGYEAQNAIEQGDFEAAALQREIGRTVGTARAAAGGSGLLVNKGSALDVQEDTARQGALDVARIKYNALLKAYGYKIENLSDMYQADIAKTGGKYNAAGELLGGIGSLYGKF